MTLKSLLFFCAALPLLNPGNSADAGIICVQGSIDTPGTGVVGEYANNGVIQNVPNLPTTPTVLSIANTTPPSTFRTVALEFDLSGLPAGGFIINSATLSLDYISRSHSINAPPMTLHTYGYSGDGVITASDFTATGGTFLPAATTTFAVGAFPPSNSTMNFDVTGLDTSGSHAGLFITPSAAFDLSIGITFERTAKLALDFTAVPEPSSFGILALTMLGFCRRRRRPALQS